jgi:hypothetical protein
MSRGVLVRLAQHLIWWYPRAWRARYADEMLDLLRTRPITWGDLVNLAIHGLYTRLHPDLILSGEDSDASVRERLAVLMRALRSSEVAIFGAFVAAMIAWLQFGGLVDGGPYMSLTDSAGVWPSIDTSPANGISAAMAVQSAAVDLAFLAVFAGGLPLVVVAWRRSPALRRYFLVPMAALFGAVLPGPIAILLRMPPASINLTFTTITTDAYFLWFVGLAVVSVLALRRVIAGGELADGLLRYALIPSIMATLALLLLLGSTLAWGIAAHQEVPLLFDHYAVNLGHVTVTSWLFDVLVMAVAAAVAVLASVRGAISVAATRSHWTGEPPDAAAP